MLNESQTGHIQRNAHTKNHHAQTVETEDKGKNPESSQKKSMR